MKSLSVVIYVISYYSAFACSSSATEGFCQNIEGDTTYISLGVKLNDLVVYDSTGQTTIDHIVYTGMSFKVIETIRGNVPCDTVTVWSQDAYFMCTLGTYDIITGDTVLIKLMSTNFTIDSLESSFDYLYPNAAWYFTNVLRFKNDSLRGLVYEDYRSYIFDPNQYPIYHPDVWYQIHNVNYNEFKQNILNGLTCYDYTSVEEKKNNSLIFYPNPCFNVLNLELNNPEDFVITITDITGKTVSSKIKVLDKKIDLSFIGPGVYILNIQDGVNSKSVKFLKWVE